MTSYKFIQPRRPLEFNEAQILKSIAKNKGIYVSPKADGVRLQIIFATDGSGVAIRSREDKPFRALADYEAYLNNDHLRDYRVDLAGWTIEAEGIVVDTMASPLNCAATAGTLQRKEQLTLGRLCILVFDMHHPEKTKGMDLRERMEDSYQMQQAFYFLKRVAHSIRSLGVRQVHTMEKVMDAYQWFRAHGYEGAVLTPVGAPYASGKKVAAGWKVKPEETKEATVTGLIEAVSEDGTPKEMIGSLSVAYEDGSKGKVGAGCMAHPERAHYWKNPEEILGRLIEVSSMETNETGGQRHPVFKMFRDDPRFKGVKV